MATTNPPSSPPPGTVPPGGQTLHGVSIQQYTDLLQRAGAAAPLVFELLQKFVEVLQGNPQVAQALQQQKSTP